MKNRLQKKLIVGGILSVFILISISPGLAQTTTQQIYSLEFQIYCSEPVLKENNGFNEILLTEATGVITTDGSPQLPTITKTFEFPLGTQITSITVFPSTMQTMRTEKQIKPVPTKQKIDNQIIPLEGAVNEDIYNSNNLYPNEWYILRRGAGLNKENEHVVFLSCQLNPTRYLPAQYIIQYCREFSIQITYTIPLTAPIPITDYQLVVITPAEFTETLQPLVSHKNTHGLPTTMVTLEQIYTVYTGRDNPEKIKTFIKQAIEDWDTQYILLVGDMKKLPIRFTYASWWEDDLLSDQYYADIYDGNGEFCTWDKNSNNRFGETNHDGEDLDGVDLYADVHVGRFACVDVTELTTVVNKIITYEDDTYNQAWFKKIILAGGDTFPSGAGDPQSVYEGETTNTYVAETVPEFEQTFLWTSTNTLRASSFNREINQGAGFVSYAGHGFEHGWGTYKPNSPKMIYYYTPFVNGLKNDNMLPVIFFDACLTAKLDFNYTDLENYYPRLSPLLAKVFRLSTDPLEFYPCFAWRFLIEQDGGAIGTVGSTRTAYTHVDSNGVHGGAGYLDVAFFDSYEDGIHLGQMLTGAQNRYINNVGADYFTIEEFMLLGDPSLMLGGYQ